MTNAELREFEMYERALACLTIEVTEHLTPNYILQGMIYGNSK